MSVAAVANCSALDPARVDARSSIFEDTAQASAPLPPAMGHAATTHSGRSELYSRAVTFTRQQPGHVMSGLASAGPGKILALPTGDLPNSGGEALCKGPVRLQARTRLNGRSDLERANKIAAVKSFSGLVKALELRGAGNACRSQKFALIVVPQFSVTRTT